MVGLKFWVVLENVIVVYTGCLCFNLSFLDYSRELFDIQVRVIDIRNQGKTESEQLRKQMGELIERLYKNYSMRKYNTIEEIREHFLNPQQNTLKHSP